MEAPLSAPGFQSNTFRLTPLFQGHLVGVSQRLMLITGCCWPSGVPHRYWSKQDTGYLGTRILLSSTQEYHTPILQMKKMRLRKEDDLPQVTEKEKAVRLGLARSLLTTRNGQGWGEACWVVGKRF